jgi:hypothetical protein
MSPNEEGGEFAGFQPMSRVVHIEPNKLRRSDSIFILLLTTKPAGNLYSGKWGVVFNVFNIFNVFNKQVVMRCQIPVLILKITLKLEM